MLSYMLAKGGDEFLYVCLEPPDLLHLTRAQIEMPLSDLRHAASEDEVGHLARITLVLLPPGSTDFLLRASVEARDDGRDVRIEKLDHPGDPG